MSDRDDDRDDIEDEDLDETAAWEKVEERFASLMRLGGDPRTPDHERDAACRQAIRMFMNGKMTVTSTGRWTAVTKTVREMLHGAQALDAAIPADTQRCIAPYNLNGRNGWRCCKCKSLNVELVVHYQEGFWRHSRCTTCLHVRCDRVSDHTDPAHDPPGNRRDEDWYARWARRGKR